MSYEQYHQREVHLVVDGRGYDANNWSYDSNVSLGITATVKGENETLLHLEDICILNINLKKRFRTGSINKSHIIGIFEGEKEERE